MIIIILFFAIAFLIALPTGITALISYLYNKSKLDTNDPNYKANLITKVKASAKIAAISSTCVLFSIIIFLIGISAYFAYYVQ